LGSPPRRNGRARRRGSGILSGVGLLRGRIVVLAAAIVGVLATGTWFALAGASAQERPGHSGTAAGRVGIARLAFRQRGRREPGAGGFLHRAGRGFAAAEAVAEDRGQLA